MFDFMKTELTDGLLEEIPVNITNAQTLQIINQDEITAGDIVSLKELTGLSDEKIATCLDISVKTFRSYKKKPVLVIGNKKVKEQLVMLISLLKHGIEVFGSKEHFDKWLETKNFYFDHDPPIKSLDSIAGIRFVDDQLTGLEFGDNA